MFNLSKTSLSQVKPKETCALQLRPITQIYDQCSFQPLELIFHNFVALIFVCFFFYKFTITNLHGFQNLDFNHPQRTTMFCSGPLFQWLRLFLSRILDRFCFDLYLHPNFKKGLIYSSYFFNGLLFTDLGLCL